MYVPLDALNNEKISRLNLQNSSETKEVAF